MKRSLALLGTAIILSVGLTACSGAGVSSSTPEDEREASTPSRETNTPSTNVFVQTLPDGREVLCVWAKSGYGGGLSCDWDSLDSELGKGVK